MKKFYLIVAATFAALFSTSCSSREIVIDKQLPAGNIVFERVVNDTVHVHQELRG
jgi:hypothetical protein